MIKVYISAPIRGHELDERRRYFKSIETMLRDSGFRTVNPMSFKSEQEGERRADILRRDIRLMLSCDMVMVFGDWHSSEGCMLERTVAEQCGIPVVGADFFDDGVITDYRDIRDGEVESSGEPISFK